MVEDFFLRQTGEEKLIGLKRKRRAGPGRCSNFRKGAT